MKEITVKIDTTEMTGELKELNELVKNVTCAMKSLNKAVSDIGEAMERYETSVKEAAAKWGERI